MKPSSLRRRRRAIGLALLVVASLLVRGGLQRGRVGEPHPEGASPTVFTRGSGPYQPASPLAPSPPSQVPELPGSALQSRRVVDRATMLAMKRLCYSVSPDCVHWSAVGEWLRGCDTPQLARLNKRLYLYFVAQPQPPSGSPLQRREVTVASGGNVVLGPAEGLTLMGEAHGGQTDPSVLEVAPGQYRLFYVHPPPLGKVPDPVHAPVEIHSACSSDGLTWTVEPGARLSGVGLVDPEAVLTADGDTRLYYTLGKDFSCHSALSIKGGDFVEESGRRLAGSVTSTVRTESGDYLTVFQSLHWGPHPNVLQRARSHDGLTFSPPVDLALELPLNNFVKPEAPSLARLPDGRWLLTFVLAPTRDMTIFTDR